MPSANMANVPYSLRKYVKLLCPVSVYVLTTTSSNVEQGLHHSKGDFDYILESPQKL